MALTVYAENMGLFHKGSNGKGIAPGDVCLTPPPPPAGPVPVPYVNMASASDLSKGSTSVKVDGEPTALEDKSECSTSTGDEPGQQGGNVITHKTKGKAFFQLWSFTVKVEGKGVGRHGDLMGQNSGTPPAGAVDMAALTAFEAMFPNRAECPGHFVSRSGLGPTKGKNSQTSYIQGMNATCWVPGCSSPGTTPDHQPPLVIAWYMGGCHGDADGSFKAWATSNAAVKPQCTLHSDSQGGMGALTRGVSQGLVTVGQVTLRVLTYLL